MAPCLFHKHIVSWITIVVGLKNYASVLGHRAGMSLARVTIAAKEMVCRSWQSMPFQRKTGRDQKRSVLHYEFTGLSFMTICTRIAQKQCEIQMIGDRSAFLKLARGLGRLRRLALNTGLILISPELWRPSWKNQSSTVQKRGLEAKVQPADIITEMLGIISTPVVCLQITGSTTQSFVQWRAAPAFLPWQTAYSRNLYFQNILGRISVGRLWKMLRLWYLMRRNRRSGGV